MNPIRLRKIGSFVMFLAWLSLISNHAVLFTAEGLLATLLQVALTVAGTWLLYQSWKPRSQAQGLPQP
ncbi:hypothetical protein CQ010_03535 [Arthrobacter sp. MYb211]|uniref:hypothetical protein n=1 Tax=Micrococcaceae TaxID=1268 RepID=UPI000CFDE1CA|nr:MULTISPECIES: hypothetical protein [unclassified Arthrobacter]PRA01350.1 hypothetical protein CQ017_02315 [Arthrobacter sp. MYb224]PRA12612.1 hypothetical protein CQ015_04995 [Arthrobacter sp. MYb221]PRC09869.1 hypothetical protein CQ010_03535 [Arthrobacter sp. MYb211]